MLSQRLLGFLVRNVQLHLARVNTGSAFSWWSELEDQKGLKSLLLDR